MTLVPFTECCLWLGIDPKTLRLWLKAAHLSGCLHPTDARLKGLTFPQLQQLAELHGRCLPSSLPGTAPAPVSLPASAPPSAQMSVPPTGAGGATVSTHADDAELRHQLTLLQHQVATLQAQVTELALALVRGSFPQSQQPASSFQPPPAPLSPSTPAPTTRAARSAARAKASAPRAAPPERSRARSRALPLIESCPDGTYVAISPTQGVLSLVPDSPAWFAWLSSLTAFAFQGQQGHFSATRKFRNGQRVQSWNVHRSLHGRSCNLYLGLTHTLTVARLEDMAAAVHTRLTAL